MAALRYSYFMARDVPPEGPWVNLSVSLRQADRERAERAAGAAGLRNARGEPNVSAWARPVLLAALDATEGGTS
jgi:hypothetical protein